MSMFDSIITGAAERFSLGNKAESVLAALLGLMTDQSRGGFSGFLSRFNEVGLGDVASSWISTGANTPISNEQTESVLGEPTIGEIAAQSDLSRPVATSALAYMIPSVIDRLTPNGIVPEENDFLSLIGGFIPLRPAATGATLGAVGAFTSGTGDRIGTAVDENQNALNTPAATAYGSALDGVDSGAEGDTSILRWLLPLILLLILTVLGYMFCSKSNVPTTTVAPVNTNRATSANTVANTNATAKTVDSRFRIEARDGKYIVSGIVPDQKTLDEIKARLTAEFGEANVDFAGLKVDAKARPFTGDWWSKFEQLLPSLKDWKTGTLAFAGNAITEVSGLPTAAIDRLKALFSGWRMPVSLMGAESATKQANEEALRELSSADSVDEVVNALNLSIINFASASSAIPADAKPVLEKAAEVLKKQPAGTVVEISGHTDSDGNDDANLKLSQQRAESVKNALAGLGVNTAMLTAKGYGETEPVAPNDTADNKFKNRRIAYKTGDGTAPTATNTNTANANK